MTKFLTALVLGIVLLSGMCVAEDQAPPAGVLTPKALEGQLRRFPGMRLVESSDISAEDCGVSGAPHPGWISADFTGTGREDFAVLLLRSQASGQSTFEGRHYSQHEFSLMVLLSKGNGEFDPVTLKTFVDNVPTIKGLKIQPTGPVFDLDAGKRVQIRHPSITFYACGQFENVYHWTGSRFDELVTSR